MAFDTPQSRNEALLQNILGAANTYGIPQSRIEAILQNMLGEDNELVPPQSRNEELLLRILAMWKSGQQAGAVAEGVSLTDGMGGTIAHYTKDEFLALDALPAVPPRDRLVGQGWNWDLDDAKSYVRDYGMLIIGAQYTTASGKTEITVELQEGRLSPCIGLGVNGTVKIDWGDGSDEEELTGTSTATTVFSQIHNYTEPGTYIIAIDVSEGAEAAIKGATAAAATGDYIGSFLLAKTRAAATTDADAAENQVYLSSIKTINVGNGMSIENGAFRRCVRLSAITIPASVTRIGTYAFNNAVALSAITIPADVTNINTFTFNNNLSLTAVEIPASATSIGQSAFSGCRALSAITIPAGVENIRTNAFNGCYGVKVFTLLPTEPPALANANAFANIAADARIVVPWSEDHSILAAYQGADNWSELAAIIVEAPQPSNG